MRTDKKQKEKNKTKKNKILKTNIGMVNMNSVFSIDYAVLMISYSVKQNMI